LEEDINSQIQFSDDEDTDEELKEHYREINNAFLGQERLKN